MLIPKLESMSHKKAHSQGSIPFAWEDKPGVSKPTSPIQVGLNALKLIQPPPSPPSPGDTDSPKIPPPPCLLQEARRSTSGKGLRWWQEDPFLAAYKECTKSVRSGKLGSESRRNIVGSKTKKSKLIFSCKDSCDVRDDNFLMLSNLPPLPKDRIRVTR